MDLVEGPRKERLFLHTMILYTSGQNLLKVLHYLHKGGRLPYENDVPLVRFPV